ncbi:MAG: hypothetical protein PVH18_10270 [Chloroflexota bacterium]
MLTKPPIPDEQIAAQLLAQYGIPAARVEFLPLGADRHAAVYRVIASDQTPRPGNWLV